MRNILPSTLRPHLENVEQTVTEWPLEVSFDNVLRWILQFDCSDYPLAIRLLQELHVVGSRDVRTALEIANTKLLRSMADKGSPFKNNNTLYASIGGSSKSGSLIAYHYRIALELPETDFVDNEEQELLDLTNVENIVLVDDIIGTGKTIAKEISTVATEIYTLNAPRNLFVLTVAGYQDGIEYVTKETGAEVVCALEFTSADTVSSLDSSFYLGMSVTERHSHQDRIKRYCRSISKSELGYGNVGGLLVFDHNTPNTTLPIIWSSGRGWKPLFPRTGRIIGAAKVLKSATSQREQEAIGKDTFGKSNPSNDVLDNLTLFVEGRVDELFVDFFIRNLDLNNLLDIKTINSVAIGGLYQSDRLIGLLRESKKHAVFVLDNDEQTRRAEARLNAIEGSKILYLEPNFAAMLDVEKIYQHQDRFRGLPSYEVENRSARWFHDLETAVLRKGNLHSNGERNFQILDEFLDRSKYQAFVEKLKQIVGTQFRANNTTDSPGSGLN